MICYFLPENATIYINKKLMTVISSEKSIFMADMHFRYKEVINFENCLFKNMKK